MDLTRLKSLTEDSELSEWVECLPQQLEAALANDSNSKLVEWKNALNKLPSINAEHIDLTQAVVKVISKNDLPLEQKKVLEESLKVLMPWRKGPYHIHGVDIDTEWRSDFKWQRLQKLIKPLKGRRILDVGCGNGYHGWRMLGDGAELVIGIDPSVLFSMQFMAIKHFVGDENLYVLPLGIEDVPENLQAFDSVFSMGVLYHRRSPIDHLYQLKQCLRPGGQLILETLVIEGNEDQVLVPGDRYAQMRNVWFIPSSQAIKAWLSRCGYKNIELIDESYTRFSEQRATDWMRFHSLKDFLDPDDPSKTIEGYPAPLRAVFTAEIP